MTHFQGGCFQNEPRLPAKKKLFYPFRVETVDHENRPLSARIAISGMGFPRLPRKSFMIRRKDRELRSPSPSPDCALTRLFRPLSMPRQEMVPVGYGVLATES